MAIDLTDLVESLQREVNPPGTDLFPNATEDQWLGNLRDSFWEAKLFGFFDGFTESEGIVTPTSGSTDVTRAYQQLIVLFAGGRIITNELRNIKTVFRAQAGPVEYETQQSATLLRDILKEVRKKIEVLVEGIGDFGETETTYINSLTARFDSLAYGDTYFWE